MSIPENTTDLKTDLFEKCLNFTRADDVKAAGLYPYFQPISSAPDNEVTIKGKKMIMIGSNDYLGLAHNKELYRKTCATLDKLSLHSSKASLLVSTLSLSFFISRFTPLFWSFNSFSVDVRMSDCFFL